MAKRQIRISTDEVLRKICKPVKEITPNTLTLLDDMAETMYDANGDGLAAPQVSYVFAELKKRGYDVPTDVYTVKEAKEVLLKLVKQVKS